MNDSASTVDLVKTLGSEASELMSLQLSLVKTETAEFINDHVENAKRELNAVKHTLAEKAEQAMEVAKFAFAGGLVIYIGAFFLLVALALGINDAVAMSQFEVESSYMWVGPLAVGLLTTLVGFVLVRMGNKAKEKLAH